LSDVTSLIEVRRPESVRCPMLDELISLLFRIPQATEQHTRWSDFGGDAMQIDVLASASDHQRAGDPSNATAIVPAKVRGRQ